MKISLLSRLQSPCTSFVFGMYVANALQEFVVGGNDSSRLHVISFLVLCCLEIKNQMSLLKQVRLARTVVVIIVFIIVILLLLLLLLLLLPLLLQ